MAFHAAIGMTRAIGGCCSRRYTASLSSSRAKPAVPDGVAPAPAMSLRTPSRAVEPSLKRKTSGVRSPQTQRHRSCRPHGKAAWGASGNLQPGLLTRELQIMLFWHAGCV